MMEKSTRYKCASLQYFLARVYDLTKVGRPDIQKRRHLEVRTLLLENTLPTTLHAYLLQFLSSSFLTRPA